MEKSINAVAVDLNGENNKLIRLKYLSSDIEF